MTDPTVPLWGQLSIAGILLGIVGWVVIAVLSGRLIPIKRQEQLDAIHSAEVEAEKSRHAAELEAERVRHAAELEAEQARSRAWQEAWQAGQNLDAQKTETIRELASLAETFQKFIRALPQVPKVKVESNDQS